MDMLYFDALRGMDSTGVFGVDKHANVQIYKEATPSGVFLKTTESSEFKRELIRCGMFAVGHNRAATRGKINDANAHPFWVDDKIVLVQNGTYHGDHSTHKNTEVDTEAVAHVIAETPDIEAALQKINAAYALVWFNTETKTLYLIRNDERPLYLAWANQCLMWCSDPGFLYLAASRNDLKLTTVPTMLAAHELVELTIEGNQWKYSSKQIDAKYRHTVYDNNTDNAYPLTPWLQNASRRVVGLHSTKNVSDVDKLLSEILVEEYPLYHIPVNDLSDIKAGIENWHNVDLQRNYPIQIRDYKAANNNPHCTTWHVWGEFSSDFDVFPQKVVAHWFVYGKTEQEVLEYTDAEFATAKIAAIRSYIKNGTTGVITVFMHDIKQFQTVQVING